MLGATKPGLWARHSAKDSALLSSRDAGLLEPPEPGPGVDPGGNPQGQSTRRPCPPGAKTPVRDTGMKQTRKERAESEKPREGLEICCSGQSSLGLTDKPV